MGKGDRVRECALERLAYQYWKRFGFHWVPKPKKEGEPVEQQPTPQQRRKGRKDYKPKPSGGPRAIARRQRQIAKGMLKPTEGK